MKKPVRKIKNPCPITWESMDIQDNSTQRFCRVCEKTVFDISAKTESEVDNLYFSNEANLCVRALSSQLNQDQPLKRNFSNLIRRGKIASLILVSSLFGQKLIAQEGRFSPNSFKIVQQEISNSQCIRIEGTIRGERKIGSRKIENAILSFYTTEHLKIGQINTDRNGKFEIEIDKRVLGDSLLISVSAPGFENLETGKLTLENKKIKMLLAKELEPIIFVGGRYF